MLLRIWRFATILAAAVTMSLEFAHLLEMPQKTALSAPLYLAVTHSLYKYFAVAGAASEVGGILLGAILCYLVRKRTPAFALTCAATVLMAATLAVWIAFIAPMNTEFARWTASTIPPDWTRVRDQWEHAHALGAVLSIAAVMLLLWSVLSEIPAEETARPSGL